MIDMFPRVLRPSRALTLPPRALVKVVKLLGLPVLIARTELEIVVRRVGGDLQGIEDLGVVSCRVITDAGAAFLASACTGSTEMEALNWHAIGTDSTAEAVGDTALGAEVEARVSGTQSNPAANQYRSVATITATAQRLVREHGLLSANAAGTLWDRSVFALQTLEIGDSLTFTHTTTYDSGG